VLAQEERERHEDAQRERLADARVDPEALDEDGKQEGCECGDDRADDG